MLIVGTDHRFQTRGPDFTEPQHRRFAAYVWDVVKANGVAALAEENNHQVLVEADVSESTVQTIARELGLKHRFCDPDMQTRIKLGIRQENQIRISVFPKQLAEAEVQQQLDESMRARERYWLSELVEFNVWPVLFVCGADHSSPFLNLLRRNNFDAVLAVQDWGT